MNLLRRHRIWLMPLIAGSVLLLLWFAVGRQLEQQQIAQGAEPWEAEGTRRIMLPYPGEVWDALLARRDVIAEGTRNTFVAATIGFLAAVGAGYGIALILASSIYVKQALYPWILVLQMTPVVILAPILAIWMGQGIVSIAAVTFLIGFFPVVANSTMGLLSTDQGLRDLFAVCRASRWQELLYLRIPHSMPHFLTGMKIAGTLAPIGAITGDLFVGSSAAGGAGLGFLTVAFKASSDTPAVFATAGVACLLGFVFVGCTRLLHWWALRHWHESVVRKGI